MRAIVLVVGVATLACAISTPGPPLVRQSTAALAPVPYPPPPARAELVPPRPRSSAVWIDGEWTWQVGRWTWRPGRWVVPPAGARFAVWTTVRDRLGTLYFAPGGWRTPAGESVAEPEPLVTADP